MIAWEESGSGLPIVLLHGITEDRRVWDRVIPLLDDQYRCVRLDLRGHGESPPAATSDRPTRLRFFFEASNPPVGALARDPHGLRDVSDGPALFANTVHEQAPAMRREASVTVRHEDLRVVKTAISTAPEVFFQINNPSPTSWPSTPRRFRLLGAFVSS